MSPSTIGSPPVPPAPPIRGSIPSITSSPATKPSSPKAPRSTSAPAPRRAVGPDLWSLFLGTAGRCGRIHTCPPPRHRQPPALPSTTPIPRTPPLTDVEQRWLDRILTAAADLVLAARVGGEEAEEVGLNAGAGVGVDEAERVVGGRCVRGRVG